MCDCNPTPARLLEQAIVEERITRDELPAWERLFEANPDIAAETLGNRAARAFAYLPPDEQERVGRETVASLLHRNPRSVI